MLHLNLQTESSVPKYKQIIAAIEIAIDQGTLKKGDALPSINSIRDHYQLSRDTVLMAYNDLKARGIIQSIVGKGYYVSSENVEISQKIFVLFDELNSFKEDLYNAFIEQLNENVRVDIFFHHFNFEVFSKLIQEHNGNYNSYVIMPANLKGTEHPIGLLPENKVYILDQTKNELAQYPAVYQNFEKDIFDNLSKVTDQLSSYDQLNLIFSEEKQPIGMSDGFVRFCKTHQLKFEVIQKIKPENLIANQAYIIPEDKDLLQIIKIAREQGLKLKKDFGIISYNDTLLKEIVEGGISTISTDFKKMGVLLAQMIQNKEHKAIENPSHLIIRNSL